MADVRCPMCGKPNPPELEVCQFCQARLKPLKISPEERDETRGSAPAEGQPDVPDWLHSLRQTDSGGSSETPPSDEALEEWWQEAKEKSTSSSQAVTGVTDWLNSLREDSSSDEIDNSEEENGVEDFGLEGANLEWLSSSPGSSGGEEPPEWQTKESAEEGMPAESKTEAFESEEAESALPAEEEPEWLRRIRERQQAEAEEQEPSEEIFTKDTDHLPKWPERNQGESGTEAGLPEEEEQAPDWLSGIRSEQTEAEDDQEVLPDWESVEAEETSGEQVAPAEDEAGAEEAPEWLTELGDAKDLSSRETSLLPDWFYREAVTQETAEEPAEAAPAEEIPDWLAELGEEEQTSLSPDESAPPAWMQAEAEGQVEEEAPVEAEIPAESPGFEEASPAEEIPDWLAELGDASETGRAQGESSLLSWMKEDEAEGVEEEGPSIESGEPAEAAESEESLPDWMADALAESDATPAEGQAAPFEEPTEFIETDDFLETEGLDESDLAWLDQIGASEQEPSPDQEQEEPVTSQESVAPFSLEEEDDAGLEDLPGGELPEWLEEAAPKEGEAEEAPSEIEPAVVEDADANLAPAELPSWLEAMRPVEAAVSPPVVEGKEQVESAGPLAGLRGVLPAEPDITQIQKPPAYQLKLQVSEAQKANAELLKLLIQSEAEEKPLPSRPMLLPQHFLRFAIAIVLLGVVFWSLTTGGFLVNLPVPSPAEGTTQQIINGLAPNAPVLLAIDYEPGWSGEMNAAVEAVVDNLMFREAYLTLVSTSPTGPALAESLLATVSRKSGLNYQANDQYVDLGFIPGGPAGLQSFAQSPRQVVPLRMDGNFAWESGPLQNVNSLEDFKLAVVVTENPDTARSWIEQVRPSLGDTPLIMVVSAQAAPLVRPYYQANPQQVQGMITGLAGGVAYETLTKRPIYASPYWNTFGLSIIVAGLLILAGGVVNAGLGLFGHTKADAIVEE